MILHALLCSIPELGRMRRTALAHDSVWDRKTAIMAHTSPRSILLVDDDQDLLMLMKTGFENEGYTVLVRTSPPSRQEIDVLEPAVVFMDVNLRKDYGAALCSALKRDRHSAHPPVILISGNTEADLRQNAASSLADGCVLEPFAMRALLILAEYYTGIADME